MELSLVYYSYSLAFASGDGFLSNKMYLGSDAQHMFDGFCKGVLLSGDLIVLSALGSLYIDIEGIHVVHAVYEYLIVGCIALFDENGLYLGGEYIYAPDDHHIIASALGLAHLDESAPTGAFSACEHAKVSCAVSYQWECLFCDTCEDEPSKV